MSAGTYTDLLTALGQEESGNNYSFVSTPGYLGRYQFGEQALTAVGFYNGDSTSALDFSGSWTPLAATYGVTDKASFLASSAAQDAAVKAFLGYDFGDLQRLDLTKYVGQTIDGVHLTGSGLIGGAYLVGGDGLQSFLQSGGAVMPADWHGTTVADYINLFANYDTPFDFSTSGAESIAGGAGNDILTGGGGDDTFIGGGGTDVLRGGAGGDSLAGGAGFDDINGNQGADTIDGGSGGNDWLVGGQGDDLISAHAGQNILYGNMGSDTLHGGDGGDLLRGGQGDDVIVGGSGADWISGDLGSDTLTGGAGADTFHAGAGAGMEHITDFNFAQGDRLQLDAGTHYTVSQVGADTVVQLGSNPADEVVLAGVNASSLPSGWIFEV